MSGARRLALALALAGSAFHALPASADPSTITVGPTRLEFVGEALGAAQPVDVIVEGGVAGTLTLSMYDAAIDPQGGWLRAPYGSTDASLAGVLRIEPATFAYDPAGGRQSFRAMLSVDPARVTAPLYGSLSAAVLPPADPGEGGATVTAVAAVELQIVAAPGPDDFGELPAGSLGLRMDRLVIEQVRPWTAVDRLFPDIPVLVDHGPVTAYVQGSNAGDLVLDARVTFDFTRLSPLGIFATGQPPTLRVENRPRFLLPGQPYEDSTTSLIPSDAATDVDSLPFIGFVRISATVRGGLSGLEAEPRTLSRTVLVFPWKEALFLFLVWLGQREWRHRRGRRVHTGATPPPPTLRARVRGALRERFVR